MSSLHERVCLLVSGGSCRGKCEADQGCDCFGYVPGAAAEIIALVREASE